MASPNFGAKSTFEVTESKYFKLNKLEMERHKKRDRKVYFWTRRRGDRFETKMIPKKEKKGKKRIPYSYKLWRLSMFAQVCFLVRLEPKKKQGAEMQRFKNYDLLKRY